MRKDGATPGGDGERVEYEQAGGRVGPRVAVGCWCNGLGTKGWRRHDALYRYAQAWPNAIPYVAPPDT